MVNNGFTWAFDESNPKYKQIKNKREKDKKKENNTLYRAIFIDSGKITIMTMKKIDIDTEILKHEKLSSFTKINKTV